VDILIANEKNNKAVKNKIFRWDPIIVRLEEQKLKTIIS
jgi:hypothetical protein